MQEILFILYQAQHRKQSFLLKARHVVEESVISEEELQG